CRVRRTPDESWRTLERTEEFADFAPTRPPRTDHKRNHEDLGQTPGGTSHPLHLETVGVRGFVEDLLSALDSALVRSKLRAAALTMLVVGAVMALPIVLPLKPEFPWPQLVWLCIAVAALIAHAMGAVLITQMTFIELSRLREATDEEARAGQGKF